ncbi:hypothetical protein LTR36_000172 [Oleoguttula mirabilis]|uniref:Uncharacterized protein n=1 Tax=Oleoguttula mirabilis TaxID=1507867 RepID=A0AAV9JXT0_9PEZI|nr:hypothetical protein LTR36_000172 [Oleoguttula mirabilis]
MNARIINMLRRNVEAAPFTHTMLNLLVALLVLLILSLLLVAGLLYIRHRRRVRRAELLPLYDEKRLSTSSTSSHHRRVMIRPSESVYVYQEKLNRSDTSSTSTSPASPIPEIRITFPEECDASGKRQSGRVVVVRVGDSTVGLGPVSEDKDKLPAYGDGERFQSLDLERIGGLVEKAHNAPEALK